MPGQILSYQTEFLQIFVDSGNASYSEGVDQYFCYIRREEGRQCRAQMNVLHAQTQQGKQHNHRLLFVPRDIIGNRQFVDVVQLEDFLQLQGNDGQ